MSYDVICRWSQDLNKTFCWSDHLWNDSLFISVNWHVMWLNSVIFWSSVTRKNIEMFVCSNHSCWAQEYQLQTIYRVFQKANSIDPLIYFALCRLKICNAKTRLFFGVQRPEKRQNDFFERFYSLLLSTRKLVTKI